MTAGDERDQHARVPHRLGATTVVALLVMAFAIRLAFGLLSEFWGEDEFQIYLIGLKFYTTGVWPFYGPDVVYSQTQIPGALQGLLIGGPLWVSALPEAPYVLLNLLSTSALALLGWYIGRRVPDVPRWFLWSWVFFSPWSLDVSTHIINTSYVVIGAVPFVIGAYELMPPTRIGAVSKRVAAGLMGTGLLWIYQIHMSATLLAPMACAVLVWAVLADRAGAGQIVGWFVLGAALLSSTVIPTFVADGPAAVLGRTGANILFEPGNLRRLPQIVAQSLSFASFELPRFIGSSTTDRLAFLVRYPWAAPFVVFATIGGAIQTALLVAGLFWRVGDRPGWVPVRNVTIVVILLVFLSFTFSIKAPASHTFYVFMPVVLIYAFSWWPILLRTHVMRRMAFALTLAGAVTHVAIAVRNFTDRSLYVDRPRVIRAIQEKDYRQLGVRRSDLWESDSVR